MSWQTFVPLLSAVWLNGRSPLERLAMLYRCCFLDANDGIEALEEIETDTLTDAIDDAKAMLKSRPQHEAVELWLKSKPPFHDARDKGEHERVLRTSR